MQDRGGGREIQLYTENLDQCNFEEAFSAPRQSVTDVKK